MFDRKIHIDGLGIDLKGDHPIVNLIVEELSCRHDTLVRQVLSFTIRQKTSPPGLDNGYVMGPLSALPEMVQFCHESLGFRIRISWGEQVDSKVSYLVEVNDLSGGLKWFDIFGRLRNWTFLTPLEQQAYNFINGVLEPALLFFGKDLALLHSSAMVKNGKALLLTSSGGMGKTSGAINLVMKHNWEYLSDDITPVSSDGFSYYYPRKVMLYAYNLAGNKALKKSVFKDRHWVDRLHWCIWKFRKGLNGVRRRISIDTLSGFHQSTMKAKIDTVLFLTRYSGNDFVTFQKQPSDLAHRCRHIIATEYSHYFNYLYWWEATGYAPISVKEVLDKQENIYRKAFECASQTLLVRIPEKATPQDLADYCNGLFSNDE